MFSDFIMLHLVAIRKGIIVVLGTCETEYAVYSMDSGLY